MVLFVTSLGWVWYFRVSTVGAALIRVGVTPLGWEWSSWSGCDPFRVGAVPLEWVQTSLGWVWYFRVSAVLSGWA